MPIVPNPLWNPWANDRGTLELYRKRCRREVEEMTCAAQAADVLSGLVRANETLLDAGCGGGYYYWSLAARNVPVHYSGIDYTPEMIGLATSEMCPAAGLPIERFRLQAIEDLDDEYDTILCFNVLTNSPHYALPLERLLLSARRRLLIRENLGDGLTIRFTPDAYLDPDKRYIHVYHNTYPVDEVRAFIEDRGFAVTELPDRRTSGGIEIVADIPHTWRILLAERVST
jgi:SAM-dependent methyltransferase